MKMKDQNAKKEKLKQICDKAKHGLILDQKYFILGLKC